MRIVLKRESQDLGGQRRINLLSSSINNDPVRIQLGSQVVASRAVAVRERCFNNHAWRILVRGGGNLHVNVAVGVDQSRKLHKRVRDVVQVQFASLPRGVKCGLRTDQGEIQNIRDADFDGCRLRQINVLGDRAVIRAGRFAGRAVAEIKLLPFCEPATAGPLQQQQKSD